ncbi:MAG: RES family NAD+ phosphorylase [Acidobacteriia bacterium]|nr:RES family NAD+ phosphorylase [Terriglobia bacterium]
MPELRVFFHSAPTSRFSGTVYRICPARYSENVVSMRGSLLHGARYNLRGYFGALYTSLSKETARREVARYFTVPPIGGFVEASIDLQLNRVLDLTDRKLLRQAKLQWKQLIQARFYATQEIGLRAWECGMEALLVPSAADPAERNLAVFLDNQHPPWKVHLAKVAAQPGLDMTEAGARPQARTRG